MMMQMTLKKITMFGLGMMPPTTAEVDCHSIQEPGRLIDKNADTPGA